MQNFIQMIEDNEPLYGVYFLSKMRMDFWNARMQHKNREEIKTIISHEVSPTNPLFLASAISISLLKKHDFQSFLIRYILCEDVSDLEEHFLDAPTFESEEELDAFLRIETRYAEAMRLLSLAVMLPLPPTLKDPYVQFDAQGFSPLRRENMILRQKFKDWMQITAYHHREQQNRKNPGKVLSNPNPAVFLADCWEQLKSLAIPENWDFTRFLVLYYTWVIFNPRYMFGCGLPPYMRFFEEYYIAGHKTPLEQDFEKGYYYLSLLGEYGRNTNDAIHNSREYYENLLSTTKKEYNALLKSPLSKEEKKAKIVSMKQNFSNAQMLVRRACRFYEWNPIEIDAHGFTEVGCRQLQDELHLIPYYVNYGE